MGPSSSLYHHHYHRHHHHQHYHLHYHRHHHHQHYHHHYHRHHHHHLKVVDVNITSHDKTWQTSKRRRHLNFHSCSQQPKPGRHCWVVLRSQFITESASSAFPNCKLSKSQI